MTQVSYSVFVFPLFQMPANICHVRLSENLLILSVLRYMHPDSFSQIGIICPYVSFILMSFVIQQKMISDACFFPLTAFIKGKTTNEPKISEKKYLLYGTVQRLCGVNGRWLVRDNVQVETSKNNNNNNNNNNIYYCKGSGWLVRGACAKEWYENGEEETPERGRHGRVNDKSDRTVHHSRPWGSSAIKNAASSTISIVAQGSVYGAGAHPFPTETSLAQQVQQHADEQALEDARHHFERNSIAPEGELEQEPVVLLRERGYAGHVEEGHFGRVGGSGVISRPALLYSKRQHGRDVEQQSDQKNGHRVSGRRPWRTMPQTPAQSPAH
ncbi:hypothetical protein T4D_16022 [Trichinella pseudospiralis]|uniref:Uncharacterized protein n=1 Tax=Trichinella pseudospiralis TaxID=6337 RepID=A0A0V1FTI3_TRIPS|nr:hypothetical protein T4D_16022 [Trichinella pseudospiralis]